MSWCIVVPSNRPERLEEFLAAWEPFGHRIIVVKDEPPWERIPEWAPHRTDMIRSWGIYHAYQTEADYICSLDDDVLPWGDPFKEYEKVFEEGAVASPYFDVGSLTSFDGQMRGFPYSDRTKKEVPIQYGGWSGVLDFDAITQISQNPGAHTFQRGAWAVPLGCAVTCCAMNVAWRREYSYLMWQLPLYEGRYNRFGDIWSGLIQKRVLDSMGLPMVINGNAQVLHKRASDPLANLLREAPGIPHNEQLWEWLDIGDTWTGVTEQMYRYFQTTDKAYAGHFKWARDAWAELFSL